MKVRKLFAKTQGRKPYENGRDGGRLQLKVRGREDCYWISPEGLHQGQFFVPSNRGVHWSCVNTHRKDSIIVVLFYQTWSL